MNLIFALVAGTLRGVTKILLIVLAAGFALAVLCGALLWVAFAVIRYVLTGRKPAVVTVFSQFRNRAQQFRTGGWSGRKAGAGQSAEDIVDVQAHEVRSVLAVPLSSKASD